MRFHPLRLINYPKSLHLNIPNVKNLYAVAAYISSKKLNPCFFAALPKPVRHFIAASASEVTAFISRDGYWNCLGIKLGLDAGKAEIISIDAVEARVDQKIKVYLALAVAEVKIHKKKKIECHQQKIYD